MKKKLIVKSYSLNHKKDENPSADSEIEIEGKIYTENGTGDGQFDAFMNAVRKTIQKKW
jgi:D-citramalate synthase